MLQSLRCTVAAVFRIDRKRRQGLSQVAGRGFTWLATVPPTASIVSKLFGTRYLATLFGLTLLSHQIGVFLGAWLCGLAIVEFGDYSLMWYADMALALLAALVNLPIREGKVGVRG